MSSRECPKCRQKMEEGFIKDEGRHTQHVSKWIKGPPESSFWFGTITRGKKQFPVATYRCPGCGLLESYAK